MGWLAARRQRLPPEMRPKGTGRHGAVVNVAAMHAAHLFMRCTADVLALNSACGAPLQLLGAWQWFDSVLFHSMLERRITAAAASAAVRGGGGGNGGGGKGGGGGDGSWAALLRGDAELLRVVEALMPFALSDGGSGDDDVDGATAATVERGVLEAARCWRKMHPAQAQRQPSRAGAAPSPRRPAAGSAPSPTCAGSGATSWTLPILDRT